MTMVQSYHNGLLLLMHVLVYALVWIVFPTTYFFVAICLATLLIWASVSDFLCFEIPDPASGSIMALGLVWAIWFGQGTLWPNLVTGLGAGLLFYCIGEFYHRKTGIDGLGMGDAKLIAGLGIWVGPTGSIWLVFMASISALVTLLCLGGSKEKSGDRGIAFGPFLCLSAWAIWLYQG